jgi:hypothetical protein
VSESTSQFHLLLALERRPDSSACGRALARDAAQDLVAAVGRDLARLFPAVAGLDLALSAACYDPAELLRPGWPVYATLGRLVEISPGQPGRLIAFGAHAGAFADPALAPDAALAGGPLQLVPVLLRGPESAIAAVGAQLEEDLMERGMAGAELALEAQAAFALPLEHARFLSLADLCALTAMQYLHAGLDAVWQIVEGALFDPAGGEFVQQDELPPLAREASCVRLGSEDFAAWSERHAAGLDADALARRWAQWPARLRQVEAVLLAHGLRCERIALAANDDAGRVLRPASA